MPPLRLSSRILSTRLTSPGVQTSSPFLPRFHTRNYAQESYGTTDKKENDPSQSNPSSKATHDLEHPGPPPPSTGSNPSSSQSQSSSFTSKPSDSKPEDQEPESSPPTPKIPSNKAEPKISDQRHQPPESEEAKRHNEELEGRYERPSTRLSQDGEPEMVEKGFWSGKT